MRFVCKENCVDYAKKKVFYPEMSDTTKILTRAAINLFFNGFFADIVFSFLVSLAFFVFLFFFCFYFASLFPAKKQDKHSPWISSSTNFHIQVKIHFVSRIAVHIFCVFITLKVESSICKSNL